MGFPSVTAVRPTPDGGREFAGFVGQPGAQLFAVAHMPAGEPRASALLCPGLFSEQMTIYRTEVLLARALAGAGVATVRFQYRGTGNSDVLLDEHPTFTTMLDDVALAGQWLETLAGCAPSVYIGVRLGALVAARAVAEHPQASLCLVEPVLDGRRWARNFTRARRTAALRQSTGTPEAAEGTLEELGELEAFGFRVAWPSVQSLQGRTVDAELANARPSVCLVQMAVSSELTKEYAEWSEHRRSRGSEVSTATVKRGRSWWYVPDAWETEEDRPETAGLISSVLGWLDKSQAR